MVNAASKYSSLVLFLSGVKILHSIYQPSLSGLKCSRDGTVQDGLVTNCAVKDPNLNCTETTLGDKCDCLDGFKLDSTTQMCKVTLTLTPRSTLAALQEEKLTGSVSRQSDCMFLVVLDGSRLTNDERAEYIWFCSLVENELPASSISHSTGTSGCFGDSTIEMTPLGATTNKYILKSEDLPCDATVFHIRLFAVDQSDNEKRSDLQMTLYNAFSPEIDFNCKQNCDSLINPSKKLVYKADCLNCLSIIVRNMIVYKWDLLEPELDLADIIAPGDANAYLVIEEGVLESKQTYIFQVTGTLPDGTEKVELLKLSTRGGFVLGTCTVDPPKGFGKITLFTVTCIDFEDPEGNPLQYSLRGGTESGIEHLVRTTTETVMTGVELPLGILKNGFELPLKLTVCTQEEDQQCKDLDMGTVIVEPDPDVKVEDIAEDLEKLSSKPIENVQDAIQETLSYSSILNSKTETEEVEEETDPKASNTPEEIERKKQQLQKRKMARQLIVERLNGIKEHSIETVQQKSSVMFEVTKEKDELSEETVKLGSKMISELSSNLNAYKVNATAKQIEDTGKSIVSAVSNLMTQVGKSKLEEEAENETIIDKPPPVIDHREVTLQLLSALDSVKAVLLSNKVAGEMPTVIKTEDLSLKLEKVKSTELAGHKIEAAPTGNNTKATTFELPSGFPLPPTTSDLTLEMVQFTENPYLWSDTADDVTSAVIQLQLRTGDSELRMDDLADPIVITIPQTDGDFMMLNVSLLENTTTYIEFNKTSDESKVLIFLDGQAGGVPDNASMDFAIYNFAYNADLLEGDPIPVYNETIILGSEKRMILTELEVAGEYMIELRMNDSFAAGNVSFDLYISQIKCLYWDESAEEWSAKGCLVSNTSSVSEIVCHCYHLTSFAGGFLIMPNKLNFKEDLAMFLTFWENPVGIAAVVTVLVIYFVFIIFARRKDKKDSVKGAIVNLADNNTGYEYNYIVCVQTGSRRNSGTTANVVCVIIGEKEESEPHILFSSSDRMCQRSNMDTFVIRTKHSLGEVKQLRFWHDNTGKSPEWFVSYCQVIDPKAGEVYDFVCKCWLADCLGDNVTFKTFDVATDKQKRDLEFLFFTNSTLGFKDNHVWFSVYTHEVGSNFTTVQRVSCCLTLFMTYMLTNIMFYGIEPEAGGEQKMELGPTTITWTEVRIGMMSAMIMFPVNILLVSIFKNCRERYSRQLYHVSLDTLKMHLAEVYVATEELTNLNNVLSSFTTSKVDALAASRQEVGEEESKELATSESEEKRRSMIFSSDMLQKVKKKKLKLEFPWWFVYVAWVMLFLIVFASAFFTILYTFNYGLEVSIKWISSLVLAFGTDALVAQPSKIVMIALGFSLIFKTTLTGNRKMNINLDHTSFKEVPSSVTADYLRNNMAVYQPPKQTRSRPTVKKDDRKVYNLFYEILRYLIFLYLVLLITYGKQDVNQYYINHFISQQVLVEENMKSVTNLDSILKYIKVDIVDGLFDQETPEFINDLASLRLSPPLIIQNRKKRCGEEPSGVLTKMGIVGRHWNCRYIGNERVNFGEGWLDNASLTSTPWHYNDTHRGYVVELGSNHQEATLRVRYLLDTLWADRFTRQLKIKAVTYSAQLNLLSLMTITFSINNPSGISVEKELQSFKMYRSTHSFHVFVLVLEVMYVGYTLYFAFYVIRSIFKQKSSYFKSVWSFLDLSVVFISLNVIVVYICHFVMVDKAVQTFQETGAVLMFDTVLILDYYVSYTLALLVCCAMLKFVHMLRFNPIIYRFLAILNRAKGGLLWSALLILVLIFQFGGMFHIVAAGRLYMFRTLQASIVTLYLSLMGQYDVIALQTLHAILGPLAMLVFLICGLVIGLNIMTSVLIETLTRVNHEALPNEEAHLLALLIDRVLQWLGIKKRSEDVKQKKKLQWEDTVISETDIIPV